MSPPARWHLPLLLAFVGALSLPKFTNEFVWDDIYVIREGTVIHDWKNLPSVFAHRAMYVSSAQASVSTNATDTYRPLTLATFFVDSSLSGKDPWAYHLTNLLLHLAAVALLYVWLARFVSSGAASFAACAFGVSPYLAEAHVWINGRSDLVAAIGLLGALVALRIEKRSTRFVVVFVSMLCAMLGKETAFFALGAVPLLVLPTEGPRLRERLTESAPFALAAIAYFAARAIVLDGTGVPLSSDRVVRSIANLPWLWADGFRALVLPQSVYLRSLSEEYATVAPFARPLAALGVLAVAAWLWMRRVPFAFAGYVLFLATLLPATWITTTVWFGFGRFLYVPAIGVAMMIAAAAEFAVVRSKSNARAARALPFAAIAYVGLMSFRFVIAVGDWHDDVTLQAAADRETGGRPLSAAWSRRPETPR